MKLCKVVWYDDDLGWLAQWAGNKIIAKRVAKEIAGNYDKAITFKFEQVNVPTTKAELIRWLNANSGENG